jgi:hypothetical protein
MAIGTGYVQIVEDRQLVEIVLNCVRANNSRKLLFLLIIKGGIMRKFFLLGLLYSLLIAFCPNFLISFDFELMPLRIRYFGSVGSKNNIIIYGTCGTIYLSTDFGVNWQRQSIDIGGAIREIVNFNDTLWGVLDNGSIIFSTDNGLNWSKIRLDLPEDETLISIAVDENSIFLRGLQSIYKCSKDFEIIKVLTDDSFSPILDIYRMNDPDDVDKFLQLYYLPQIFQIGDKLIINTNSNKDNLPIREPIIISKELDTAYQVSLQDKIFLNSLNKVIFLEMLAKVGNDWVCQLGDNLYITDTSFRNFRYFFKDSLFLNFEQKRSYWTNVAGLPYFFFNNNELYFPFFKDSIRVTNTNRYTVWNGLGINKYEGTPVDTFVQVGNLFKDIYLAGDYNGGIGDYYPLKYKLLQIPTIINDSVWFYISNNNTIIFTPDRCNTWNLANYLSGSPKAILSDSLFYFLKTFRGAEVCRTTNGGLTFSPAKGFKEGDTLLLKPEYSFVNGMYIDSTGFGIIIGSTRNEPLLATFDGWSSVKALKVEFSGLDIGTFLSNFCKFGNEIIFAANGAFNNGLKYYVINYMNLNDTLLKFIYWDSLYNINHIILEDDISKFIIFATVNNSASSSVSHFEICRTLDTGKTFTTLHRIDEVLTIHQIYEHNRDSVFIVFTNPDKVYLYDRVRDSLQLLWESAEGDSKNPFVLALGGKFYIVGKELFLENEERGDLTKWVEGRWDYGKPIVSSVISNGRVALVGLSDSLRPFNYYKITLKSGGATGVEEPVVEKRYYSTKFWASEAYPVPGSVKVKARIEWDRGIDIVKAIDGVYDSMGRKVEGRERIEIREESGGGRGEVEWVCEGVPRGVYFIVFRWEGGSEAIPVVVE